MTIRVPQEEVHILQQKNSKRKVQKSNQDHMSLDERKIIQAGIENNSTKAAIARTLGKDPTTIAKEIRKHRSFKQRNSFNRPVLCTKSRDCKRKPCSKKCPLYKEPVCSRRDRSPGACNGCQKAIGCRMDKYYYRADTAEQEYRTELVDCREGLDLTTGKAKAIAEIIGPMLKKGQSIHQVLSSHPEIGRCEKTLYTYIEAGVFKRFGIDNFSLKEQVNRKASKNKYKARKEPANYEGHRYSDFLAFVSEYPETPVVEMDTLYNSVSGPYIQTFQLGAKEPMIGYLHSRRTSESMAAGIDLIQAKLGNCLFSRLFPVILTDRGPEFEKHQLFEFDCNGTPRLSIFYCDPMQSSQKPHVECNHNYVRDVIPNGYPLEMLTQDDIDIMFSHINSTPRKSLGDKTPYEIFCFLYGEDAARLLGLQEIPRDDVVLKPELIFKKKK
jgi:transposase, IS30 family